MYPLVCFVGFVTVVTLVLPGHGHADKETLLLPRPCNGRNSNCTHEDLVSGVVGAETLTSSSGPASSGILPKQITHNRIGILEESIGHAYLSIED